MFCSCGAAVRQNRHGIYICQRGHEQDIVEQVSEEFEFSSSQRRSISVSPRPSKQKQSKVRAKARLSIHTEIIQELLYKQATFLIQKRGFPHQFETVLLDLWLIWITEHGISFSDQQPVIYDSDSSVSSIYSQQSSMKRITYHGMHPLFTLGLLSLACRALRLPTTLGDLYVLASNGDLPFFDTDLKTEEFRRTSRYQIKPISLTKLQAKEAKLERYFGRKGIEIPPMNMIPVIVRFMNLFQIPPEIYIHLQHCVLLVFGSKQGRDPVNIMAMLVLIASSLNLKKVPLPRLLSEITPQDVPTLGYRLNDYLEFCTKCIPARTLPPELDIIKEHFKPIPLTDAPVEPLGDVVQHAIRLLGSPLIPSKMEWIQARVKELQLPIEF